MSARHRAEPPARALPPIARILAAALLVTALGLAPVHGATLRQSGDHAPTHRAGWQSYAAPLDYSLPIPTRDPIRTAPEGASR